MGEPLARRTAILDRREHGAEEQREAVRILVGRSNGLRHQVFRIPADLADGGMTVEDEAVLALHRHGDIHASDIVEAEAVIEQPQERPDGTGRIVVLGLGQQQRRAALEIPEIDVVAQGRADNAAAAGHHQHDLRLGIVPARFRMQAGIHPGAHRGQHRRLGEHLRVRTDADFQVLAPRLLRDQHLLEPHRVRRARLQLGEVVADQPHHFRADRGCGRRIAPRPLLDHPLQHGDREGHAGGFEDLKIDRRQQPGLCGIAAVRRRIGQEAIEIADPLARDTAQRRRRIGLLRQRADGGKARGDIEHPAIADRHHRGTGGRGQPDATDQRSHHAVIRQHRRRVQGHHRSSPKTGFLLIAAVPSAARGANRPHCKAPGLVLPQMVGRSWRIGEAIAFAVLLPRTDCVRQLGPAAS